MANTPLKSEVSWATMQVIPGRYAYGNYNSTKPVKISLMERMENSVTWVDPPHFTLDLRPGKPSFQHIYMKYPAYELGTGPSNHNSNNNAGRNIQVCVLGINDSSANWWTSDRYDRLGKMLADICSLSGCPISFPAPFFASISHPDASRNMSWTTYASLAGIIGQQHDPNSPGRWGPGSLEPAKLKSAILRHSVNDAAHVVVDDSAHIVNNTDDSAHIVVDDSAHIVGGGGEDQPDTAASGNSVDHDMTQKEFRFNPPLHRSLMPVRVDFSSWDPTGFQKNTYEDESTFAFGSKDAGPLQKLRLGRIIQYETAAGMAATNSRRMGFRFLYNPTQVSTSSTRNDSVIIDPQSTIGAVLSGINQNFQTVAFTVFLNRAPDVLSQKVPTQADYPYQIYGDDIANLRTYGTHWDLERLYRVCNGVFNMEDRGKSADIGVLITGPARLLLGPGQNHFGFVESVTWTDQMFSENMVPIMTNVDIVFRRNVDMQPEARTSFVNSLKGSGVAGEGGGSASGGGGDTDPSGSAVNVPGIRDGNGYDPMSAFKKWGLSGGSWTYGAGSSNDPYSKKSHGGALHQAWDIGAPFATPLLAGVYGVVGDLNDGVKDNVAGHNPGSGSPSNWITIHCKYKGADATVYYQHLHQNSISVSRGTKVTPTTRIAQTGNSGNSSGPHLHLATWTGRRMANTRYPTKDAEIIWAPSVLFANQGR